METKKVTLEQQYADEIKRVIFEQSNNQSTAQHTGEWETMKDAAAHKAMIFGESFAAGIKPAIITVLAIIVLMIVCARG